MYIKSFSWEKRRRVTFPIFIRWFRSLYVCMLYIVELFFFFRFSAGGWGGGRSEVFYRLIFYNFMVWCT